MDQRFSQTETEVGITEFVSENTPINGIIKHRWSDFHVREISKNGEIARLTDLVSVPEKPKAKPLAVPVDEEASNESLIYQPTIIHQVHWKIALVKCNKTCVIEE